ncbi:MAG: cadherin-like domain-containing protein [Rhodopseudomonas palustris]|nr:cadherin-like domain-containing protein [Rhodopseudomonas palustris]
MDDDVPVARNDSASQSAENQAFTIAVFGNDVFGADGVDTDNSPAAKVTFTQPAQGVVTYDGTTGLFTSAPSRELTATAADGSFTYTIEDGDGDKSTATVSLTLKPGLGADGERDRWHGGREGAFERLGECRFVGDDDGIVHDRDG